MSDLKNKLIKLGSKNPDLQPHLRPVIDRLEGKRAANRVSLSLGQIIENQAALVNRDVQYRGGGISPNSEVSSARDEFIDAAVSAVREWVSNNPGKLKPELRDRDPEEVAKKMLSGRNIYELLAAVSELGVTPGEPWSDAAVEKDFFADPPRGSNFGATQAQDLLEFLRMDEQIKRAERELKKAIENQAFQYGS